MIPWPWGHDIKSWRRNQWNHPGIPKPLTFDCWFYISPFTEFFYSNSFQLGFLFSLYLQIVMVLCLHFSYSFCFLVLTNQLTKSGNNRQDFWFVSVLMEFFYLWQLGVIFVLVIIPFNQCFLSNLGSHLISSLLSDFYLFFTLGNWC